MVGCASTHLSDCLPQLDRQTVHLLCFQTARVESSRHHRHTTSIASFTILILFAHIIASANTRSTYLLLHCGNSQLQQLKHTCDPSVVMLLKYLLIIGSQMFVVHLFVYVVAVRFFRFNSILFSPFFCSLSFSFCYQIFFFTKMKSSHSLVQTVFWAVLSAYFSLFSIVATFFALFLQLLLFFLFFLCTAFCCICHCFIAVSVFCR